jgi:hypothetical protein
MSEQLLAAKARLHWESNLPMWTARLRRQDAFEAAVRDAARSAQREIAELTRLGLPEPEAEALVLPKLILLPPETLAQRAA